LEVFVPVVVPVPVPVPVSVGVEVATEVVVLVVGSVGVVVAAAVVIPVVEPVPGSEQVSDSWQASVWSPPAPQPKDVMRMVSPRTLERAFVLVFVFVIFLPSFQGGFRTLSKVELRAPCPFKPLSISNIHHKTRFVKSSSIFFGLFKVKIYP
jgi:hypothetical protein